ncbi:MAG: UbiA family prenyltransferase [Tepidisphaeraceae bacterium]
MRHSSFFVYSCSIEPPPSTLPLYVDLDGTLIRGDTTQISALALLRKNPWQLFRAALAMKDGRAAAKQIIADHQPLDAASLPYRPEVIEYVKRAKAHGRRVVLATGAEKRYGDAVAAHLGLFDDVFGSEHGVNLTSSNKLAAMIKDGGDAFEYLGDSHADAKIFDVSTVSGWVGVKNIKRTDANTKGLYRLCTDPVNTPAGILKLVRPHQWTKNLLVFLPLLTAHKLWEGPAFTHTLLATIALCFIASACYVLNDALDITADQAHPKKKLRPLANGEVTTVFAGVLFAALLIAGLLLGAMASGKAFGALLVYLGLNLAYNLFLKRRLLVDVLALAGLYAWRPVIGGVAAGVWLSESLVIFCAFFFASLSLLKRFTELKPHADAGKMLDLPGRGYQPQDLPVVQTVGLICGIAAVLVMALYVDNPLVRQLYTEPRWLWLWCPLIGYWVVRAWLLANRGGLHHDPVVFAFTDTRSYAVIVSMLIAAWLAGPKGLP